MPSDVRLIHGDCLQAMASLPGGSVDAIVTSPPYYGLRDYGTAAWSGGDPDCDHLGPPLASSKSTLGIEKGPNNHAAAMRYANGTGVPYRDVCGKCGAARIDEQIGLESTPAAYVARLVAVFEEARRVLRNDGTLWLNLGDSYNAHPGQRTVHDKHGRKQATNRGSNEAASRSTPEMKPKDLVGIPWRVAFALQDAGWWLRSDIIWHKPNPMPESVTDRPTKAHEYIFLLAKSERYWYDHEAIKEPCKFPEGSWGSTKKLDCKEYRSFYGEGRQWKGAEKRNARTVWTQSTRPYRGAHFATFPPDLIRPCIRAGCRPGGTVLDPFFGAGTTGVVCVQEGRNCVGIELNEDYLCMAQKRIADAQAQTALEMVKP